MRRCAGMLHVHRPPTPEREDPSAGYRAGTPARVHRHETQCLRRLRGVTVWDDERRGRTEGPYLLSQNAEKELARHHCRAFVRKQR